MYVVHSDDTVVSDFDKCMKDRFFISCCLNVVLMMKRLYLISFAMLVAMSAYAQLPLRPDAFPPVPDTTASKNIRMATDVEEMLQWDAYPTYPAYLQLMSHFADAYPQLCHVDTIGVSIENRLILSMVIHGSSGHGQGKPQFFYSSTIHGDELTGFYLMLRLIDTLLCGYGNDTEITALLNDVDVYINPLANPDGTYYGGDGTVVQAIRYNSNWVDLNRNYPDPFGSDPLSPVQPENLAMMEYVGEHNFLLSANLHGGAEVMNYPWDSFSSDERPVVCADWWQDVCHRFVDTCRRYNLSAFSDVCSDGYIAGGDWYVIRNGRQDYMNYYGIRELTMEVSSVKMLPTSQLEYYWSFQRSSLINYIKEIYSLVNPPLSVGPLGDHHEYVVFPNPTTDIVYVRMPDGTLSFDLSGYPSGVHIIMIGGYPFKVLKL